VSTWNRLRLVPAVLVTALLMALSPEDAELEIENLKGEVMNDDAMVKMAEEWCPEVVEPLVFERDLFLTESIRITAMHCNRVLAVVGSGHGPGIKRAWAKVAAGTLEVDLAALSEVPPPTGARTRYAVLGGLAAATLAANGALLYCAYRWPARTAAATAGPLAASVAALKLHSDGAFDWSGEEDEVGAARTGDTARVAAMRARRRARRRRAKCIVGAVGLGLAGGALWWKRGWIAARWPAAGRALRGLGVDVDAAR